jgi:transketolase
MSYRAGNVGSHLGGALSMVEVLCVLFFTELKFNITNPRWEGRDRFILSKGHGSPSLYAVMAKAGIIDANLLSTFKANGSHLSAHPSMNLDLGLEFSTGSLGQGLSYGVGTALALRRLGNEQSRVFVLLGDGELNEGSVWEAAMSAAHFSLKNLVAIVDCNGLQQDGRTDQVMSLGNLRAKWLSFGWNAIEIDGHDLDQISSALKTRSETPVAIIANTIKGKGISFMEANRSWHHSRLTEKQLQEALLELEDNGDDR